MGAKKKVVFTLHVSAYFHLSGIGAFSIRKEKCYPFKNFKCHSFSLDSGQPSTKITVADLAAMANQNSDYFSRVFAEHMGERPLVYIQLKRIERTQHLVITTDLQLTEIS